MDVLSAAAGTAPTYNDAELTWYKNDGDGEGTLSAGTVVSERPGACDVFALDVDGDNDGIPDHQDNVYSYQPEKP